MKKILITIFTLLSVTLFAQKNLGDFTTNTVQYYTNGSLVMQKKFIPLPTLTKELKTAGWGNPPKEVPVTLYTFPDGSTAYFPVQGIKVDMGVAPYVAVPNLLEVRAAGKIYFDPKTSTLTFIDGTTLTFTSTYNIVLLSPIKNLTIGTIKYKELKVGYNGNIYDCVTICTNHQPTRPERGWFYFNQI